MSENTKESQENIKIKQLPNSEIEIEGEISADVFESYYKKAIKEIGDDMELPGFRKGHIPEKVLVDRVGESVILYEMAEMALADFYPKFIIERTIDAVGRPEIVITKIARNNPLGFKIKTAVLPVFDVPDYKALVSGLKKSSDEIVVTEKEVDETIGHIKKSWSQMQDGTEKTSAETPEPEIELTDEFVKKIGAFENVADFKAKLKENLILEKKTKEKEKRRFAVIDALVGKLKVSLPAVLVESETDRMLVRFKGNIEAMGHTFGDYLTQIKKTEKELRDGWRADAEKSIKMQLMVQKIAHAEKIVVLEDEVAKEVEHIVKQHPKADRERARHYVEEMLTQEKVFQFLEGLN